MRVIFVVLVLMLWGLAAPNYSQNHYPVEESWQKDRILSARATDARAEQDKIECDKLGWDASQDNRCITRYPTETMVWGKGFYEGLAKVSVNGKVGFINTKGKVVVKPSFKDAGYFSEGLAPFEDNNSKWGFINTLGRIVIRPRFNWAFSFREGLAAVLVGDQWGYLDRDGRIRIDSRFKEASSFSEGLASVVWYDKTKATMEKPEGEWQNTFIDNLGIVRLASSFDRISGNFDGGIAIVHRYIKGVNGSYTETYAINKDGVELWKLDSWYVSWLSDDAIVVAVGKDKDGRDLFSFRGRDGKLLNGETFTRVGQFSEGLAPARKPWVGKEGFIDKRGEFVIEPTFSSTRSFSEGLAAVEVGSLYGYIDKTGTMIIPPQFEYADQFQGGFALVAPPGKGKNTTGYIDRTGKYIWKPRK